MSILTQTFLSNFIKLIKTYTIQISIKNKNNCIELLLGWENIISQKLIKFINCKFKFSSIQNSTSVKITLLENLYKISKPIKQSAKFYFITFHRNLNEINRIKNRKLEPRNSWVKHTYFKGQVKHKIINIRAKNKMFNSWAEHKMSSKMAKHIRVISKMTKLISYNDILISLFT